MSNAIKTEKSVGKGRIIDVERLIFDLLSKQKETNLAKLKEDLALEFRKTKNSREVLLAYLDNMQKKGWLTITGGRSKRESLLLRFNETATFVPGIVAGFVNEDGSIPVHFGPLLPYPKLTLRIAS